MGLKNKTNKTVYRLKLSLGEYTVTKCKPHSDKWEMIGKAKDYSKAQEIAKKDKDNRLQAK